MKIDKHQTDDNKPFAKEEENWNVENILDELHPD